MKKILFFFIINNTIKLSHDLTPENSIDKKTTMFVIFGGVLVAGLLFIAFPRNPKSPGKKFKNNKDENTKYEHNAFTGEMTNNIKTYRKINKIIQQNPYSLSFTDERQGTTAEIHKLIIPGEKYINIIEFLEKTKQEEKDDFDNNFIYTIEKYGLQNQGFSVRVNTHYDHGQFVFHYHMHILSDRKKVNYTPLNICKNHEKHDIFSNCCPNYTQNTIIIDNDDFIAYKEDHPSAKTAVRIDVKNKKYNNMYDFFKKATPSEKNNYYEILKQISQKFKETGFNIHINNHKSHGQSQDFFHVHCLCDVDVAL